MSSGGGLHSLSTIIKRLEAATSRIEDIAAHGLSPQPTQTAQTSSTMAGPVPPPPPPPPPAPPVGAASPPPPTAADPPSVTAFDELVITGKLKPFLDLTRGFTAPIVIEQVGLVEKQFKDMRAFIKMAAACKKPDTKSFSALLVPLQAGIEAITRLKEANRKDRDWFTHLSVVAEGGPIVGWVQAEPKPAAYVSEVKDSMQYYGNRVIKESGSKDPKHAEWVRAFAAVLEETRLYVVKYHPTGLTWNPSGSDTSQYKAGAAAAPLHAAATAPRAPVTAAGGGAAAVFAQINQGESVTKSLKKVDPSQQNHKNPALKASSAVPVTPPATKRPPTRPTKPQSLQGKKPPKFLLDGNKWAIEYQENESLTVEEGEMNQQVNLYGCKKTTVIIKGKVNAVTLIDCVGSSVLVESVVSSVQVTNSPSFTIQITGMAPTITLDNTDSGQIYLSKECLGVEITTAKCSSINVSLPVEGEEDGIFEEQPVPEMFKTVIKDGKLVTSVVEHTG